MTIRVQTTVLPGQKIEIATPQLRAGLNVEVTINVPDGAGRQSQPSILEFIRSLPESRRTAEEWEEYDRQFQAERDAWD